MMYRIFTRYRCPIYFVLLFSLVFLVVTSKTSARVLFPAQSIPNFPDHDGVNNRNDLITRASRSENLYQVSLLEGEYITETWRTGVMGSGIGASGLTALDLDNDSNLEVIAGGGEYFGPNRFWYILEYDLGTGEYLQKWLSDWYDVEINRLVVTEVASGGGYCIYVARGDAIIEVFDADSLHLVDAFSTPYGSADITLADVDDDGEEEIITVAVGGIAVFDALTYELEWQSSSYGSTEVEVANVDADPALEIVTTHQVIDGINHTLEWDHSGFGTRIQLADTDSDGMAEIIGADDWYVIHAFDADTQSLKWTISTDLDIEALYVSDIEGDGIQEVVYGDGQWGEIHVYDSTTQIEEWSIHNPESGVTRIEFGDVDGDGVVEVLWGAGWTSTGPDYLFVGSTVTHLIEWQSTDIGGPLSALDVGDVDNDGVNEIVMVTFTSDNGNGGGIIFIYNAETYDLEWQSDPTFWGGDLSRVHALELADVDNDGTLEMLIATEYYIFGVVLAFDGITHDLDWQSSYNNSGSVLSLAIADIDNDAQLEVVAGGENTDLYIFNGVDGVEEWHAMDLPVSGGIYDIDIGELDGDNNPEILFSVDNGSAYVYDGVDQNQEWYSGFSNPRAVAIMDVDSDGQNEILVGDSSGLLRALDGVTHQLEWSEVVSTSEVRSLSLKDLQQDGIPELILTDDNYLLVLNAFTHEMVWQSERLGNLTGNHGHLVVEDIDDDFRDEIVFGNHYAIYVFRFVWMPYSGTFLAEPDLAQPADVITYTLGARSVTEDDITLVGVSSVPTYTTLVEGSLWASKGDWELVDDILTWTVSVSPTEAVTLTFAASVGVDAYDGLAVENQVVFSSDLLELYMDASTLIDALAPSSWVTTPQENEIISSETYLFFGSAQDSVSGVEHVDVRLNTGEWMTASGTANWVYSWTVPLTDALFTIESRAIDQVGYVEIPQTPTQFVVDRLSPTMLAISPQHGETDISITEPIEISFSEPVIMETLEFTCYPDPGGWTVTFDDDISMVTIDHHPWEYGQIYSCQILYVEDRAHHSLQPGEVSNPWAFSTIEEDIPPGIQNLYLPVIANASN